MSTPIEPPMPQFFPPRESSEPLLVIRLIGKKAYTVTMPRELRDAAHFIYQERLSRAGVVEFLIRRNRAGVIGQGSDEWFLRQTKYIREHLKNKTRKVRFVTWDGQKEKESSVVMPLTFNCYEH